MEQTYNAVIETFVKRNEDAKYQYAINGMLCDVQLVVIEPKLAKTLKKAKRWAKMSEEDLLSEMMLLAMTKWLPNFELRGSTWGAVINKTDMKTRNALIKYLCSRIEGYCKNLVENGYRTSKTFHNNKGESKRVTTFVTTNFTSLDKVLIGEDGRESSLMDGVTESLWEGHETEANIFKSWYQARKNDILTQTQLNFLDILEAFDYGDESKRLEDIKEFANINPKSVSTKLNRIKAKVNKKWQVERKFYQQTFVEKLLNRKIALLNLYLDIVNGGVDMAKAQHELTSFIRTNIDSSAIENVLDKLSLEQYKNIVSAIQNKHDIDVDVLNVLTVHIEDEIERLEMVLINEQLMKKNEMEKVGAPMLDVDLNKLPSSMYLTLYASGYLEKCS